MKGYDVLAQMIACPVCGSDLPVGDTDTRVVCRGCESAFDKGRYIWDFVPAAIHGSSPLWRTGQHLQDNGMASYRSDPEHNLAVGARQDSQDFALFCNCHGLVLDVGCGPQSWPSYFKRREEATYVGVDPLVQDVPGEFVRLRGLAEFLPFRTGVFDHVLFATSLDHLVDPLAALEAAARVCKPAGEIDVWLGEKGVGAPRPAVSPEWYRRLRKPDLAEDIFHITRLNREAFIDIAARAGLSVVQTAVHTVDAFRINYFHRLRPEAGRGRVD